VKRSAALILTALFASALAAQAGFFDAPPRQTLSDADRTEAARRFAEWQAAQRAGSAPETPAPAAPSAPAAAAKPAPAEPAAPAPAAVPPPPAKRPASGRIAPDRRPIPSKPASAGEIMRF
jgi:hypothetical protein